jgi:hypothetical protein
MLKTATLGIAVITSMLSSADVVKLRTAKAVSGDTIDITANDGTVRIDNARVLKTDIAAAAFPTGGEFHEGGRGTVLGLPTSAWASKPASGIRPICRRSKAWQVPASKI